MVLTVNIYHRTTLTVLAMLSILISFQLPHNRQSCSISKVTSFYCFSFIHKTVKRQKRICFVSNQRFLTSSSFPLVAGARVQLSQKCLDFNTEITTHLLPLLTSDCNVHCFNVNIFSSQPPNPLVSSDN